MVAKNLGTIDAQRVENTDTRSEYAQSTDEAFLQMSIYTEASLEIKFVHSEYDNQYLEVEIFPYLDVGNERKGNGRKLAVLISFIQDHQSFDSELDMKVLEKVIEVVKDSPAVNDISVNGLQWREGFLTEFSMD